MIDLSIPHSAFSKVWWNITPVPSYHSLWCVTIHHLYLTPSGYDRRIDSIRHHGDEGEVVKKAIALLDGRGGTSNSPGYYIQWIISTSQITDTLIFPTLFRQSKLNYISWSIYQMIGFLLIFSCQCWHPQPDLLCWLNILIVVDWIVSVIIFHHTLSNSRVRLITSIDKVGRVYYCIIFTDIQ